MKNLFATALLVTSLTLLAGCPSKPKEQPAPPAQQSTADTSGVDNAGATMDSTESAGPSGELLSKRIVYFDFDRAEIRADSQSVVAAHAAYLAKNPAQKVRLEGHADERGSREYNIGLGERRAQAVRRALLLQGVGEVQLSTVSYGEERPAAAGSDEQAYALNRRVEIVYLK
ncbi:MAG TPA: peptidoglycan-associated lipoprotein Pal [Steroidobacteraceae bacterium]|jgi:peptidoglycan-associated lipoprotein|nr:peptidoglycan-associated lipoprotein Pal [Steroidobacteraceae bacterium]